MAKYCKYSTVMNQVEQRLIYLIKTPHISHSQVRYGVFAVHYSDIIMSMMVSQITIILFTQPFVQAPIKENIKAPHHWPLWGELSGDWWIPRTKGQ